MVFEIANVLSASELQTACSLLDDAAWTDGRESAGSQAASVKNNAQLQRDSRAATEIQAMVLRALDCSPMFFSASLPRRIFTPHINRYGGSRNAYGPHVDNAIRFTPDTGQRIRTDLAATLFLSDPAEYEGGELVMGDGLKRRRIRLSAGSLLLYSATTVHQVTPVTQGYRLGCFFWVESMVRSDEQRQLLFDLDMAILALRQRLGECEETVRLTGTYHNLLRMWADA